VNPERFDPERFAPEAIHERSPLCYFPFSSGQRMCIGADFATTEALVFLNMAIQKYRLARVSKEPVELLEQVTLRSRGGLPMKISKALDVY
jgi:cytochrome P450